jgi:hypothetical protein
MAQQHYIMPTVPDAKATAVRLGASNALAAQLTTVDEGKFVRLAGSSQYDLTTVGQDIEGVIYAVETAAQNLWSIGSVYSEGRVFATADGLQATPGVGTLAVGDIVVTGTPVAKGTKATAYPKVCKATTPANVVFKWRVVSLHTANTGAVGTVVVIERI